MPCMCHVGEACLSVDELLDDGLFRNVQVDGGVQRRSEEGLLEAHHMESRVATRITQVDIGLVVNQELRGTKRVALYRTVQRGPPILLGGVHIGALFDRLVDEGNIVFHCTAPQLGHQGVCLAVDTMAAHLGGVRHRVRARPHPLRPLIDVVPHLQGSHMYGITRRRGDGG